MHTRFVLVAVVLAWVLVGCSAGSSTPTTTAASTSISAAVSTATLPCAPSHDDCTPDQVIATVRQLLQSAGATGTEAACIAPITGHGKHSVSAALGRISAEQTRDAIRCVGSEARLHDLAMHIPPVKGFDSAESCTTEGRLIVPISGSPSPPNNWETMSPQVLRAAGWRIVHESLPPVCAWGS